jgi:hypothetical protein
MNQSGANRPIPVAHRNTCPHCKLDIPDGARVCHHCHQFVSVRFNLANIITIIVSVAAVSMSVYSLYMTATQAQISKQIESRRFLIETLHNMQQIQDDLQMSRGNPSGEDNLNEKQILLLNYYQVLSRTLVQYIKQDPGLFVKIPQQNPSNLERYTKMKKFIDLEILRMEKVICGITLPVLTNKRSVGFISI